MQILNRHRTHVNLHAESIHVNFVLHTGRVANVNIGTGCFILPAARPSPINQHWHCQDRSLDQVNRASSPLNKSSRICQMVSSRCPSCYTKSSRPCLVWVLVWAPRLSLQILFLTSLVNEVRSSQSLGCCKHSVFQHSGWWIKQLPVLALMHNSMRSHFSFSRPKTAGFSPSTTASDTIPQQRIHTILP